MELAKIRIARSLLGRLQLARAQSSQAAPRAKRELPSLTSTIAEEESQSPSILGREPALPHEQPHTDAMSDSSLFIYHRRRAPASATLPPVFNAHAASQTRLTEAQVAEMQRLRADDAAAWTVSRLAARFACSPLMVSKLAPCPETRVKLLADRERKTWERSGAVRRAKLVRRDMVRKIEGW